MKKTGRHSAGFTLLEVMVVMVILGLLAAVVAPNVLSNQERAMKKKVVADIAALEQALDLYKLDNHKYPTTNQGLEALLIKPADDSLPNYNPDGYIRRLPNDPWGNPYLFLSPGVHRKFDIYSYGVDGVAGGDGDGADIGNW